MALSQITIATIANPNNDIRCDAGENGVTKGWIGFIYLYRNKEPHALLSTSVAEFESE